MKIYTKKGDQGQTSLFGGGLFPKDNVRIEAYGTVDELNSTIGLVGASLENEKFKKRIIEIQKQLFILGSELASINPSTDLKKGFIKARHIHQLEREIDLWENELPPLKKFILPGGVQASVFLHLSRTVCRRAERQVVSLSHQDEIRPIVIQYLNRLSDWLFVLARWVNHTHGESDILWEGLLE